MAYGGALDPIIDVWSQPFWDACKNEKLTAQRCRQTKNIWFPPGPVSPFTRTSEWDWVELSGRGRVLSYVVMHQLYFDSFASRIPYPVAQIMLDEGAMMLSGIVGIPNEDIHVGMPVEVVFENENNWMIPNFRRAA